MLSALVGGFVLLVGPVVTVPSVATAEPAPTRLVRAPGVSVHGAIPGERYLIKGAFPRALADHRVQLERRTSSGRWAFARKGRLTERGRYRFAASGSERAVTWRVVLPRRSARVPMVRSRLVRVSVATQTIAINDVPSTLFPGRSLTLSATSWPARPGRRVDLIVRDRSGVTLAELVGYEDMTGRVSFDYTAPTVLGSLVFEATGAPYRGAISTSATVRTRVGVTTPAPMVIAHRGGDPGRENTLAAYRRAVLVGADALETDAQRTSDGQWVLMHDPSLLRTTDVATVFPGRPRYNVSDLTLDEIRQLRVGATREPVPTLEEFLQFVSTSRVPALVESKVYGSDAASSILEVARRVPGVIGPGRSGLVEFDCFDARTLRFLREDSSEARLGYLANAWPEDMTGLAGMQSIVLEQRAINSTTIAAAKALGLQLYAWTVNDVAEESRLTVAGVDGIITDNPETLHAVLMGE